MVRADAVDLLRVFKGAEPVPCFRVADGDMQLNRRQCRGKGRVGIAVYKKSVRFLCYQNFLYGGKHGPGHLAVAAAGNAKIIVRLRYFQLFKKDVGHVMVIVLAGMDQDLLCPEPENPGNHGSFYKLGPRADNRRYLHHVSFLGFPHLQPPEPHS